MFLVAVLPLRTHCAVFSTGTEPALFALAAVFGPNSARLAAAAVPRRALAAFKFIFEAARRAVPTRGAVGTWVKKRDGERNTDVGRNKDV